MLEKIKNKTFKVLDEGHIRVIDWMGDDNAIVQSARVSYGDGTKTKREDDKLINYLIKHGHVSPLEHCTIKLHLKLPMFVDRQLFKHTFKKNEVSARYSELPREQYLPSMTVTKPQSKVNKQGRSENEEFTTHSKLVILNKMKSAYEYTNGIYDELIELGFTRELARCVLPVATYTEYYMTINLRDLMFLLKARLDSHAQHEIREYANVIAKEIMPLWVPSTWTAFQEHYLSDGS